MYSSFVVVGLGGGVHSVDSASGTIRWSTVITNGRHQLCIHKERVYVAVEGGKLYVLDVETGSINVQTQFSGYGQAPTLLIDQDRVFVSYGGELSAFDLEGRLLWTNPFKGSGNGSMSLATSGKDRQVDEF